MDQPPPSEYRVIEREGRLVVERNAQPASKHNARPAAESRVRLTGERKKFDLDAWATELFSRLKNEQFHELGLQLFRKRFVFDVTENGDAIMWADSLSNLFPLDARSLDQFYVTPSQQALLGWIGTVRKFWLPLALFSFVFLTELGAFSVPFFFIIGTIALALWNHGTKSLQSIAAQRYEPPRPSGESDRTGA